VDCWVATYKRVMVDIPQYPAAGENVTTTARRSVDYEWREDHKGRQQKVSLEMVTDERSLNAWAKFAEEQRKAAWKLERRGARRAA